MKKIGQAQQFLSKTVAPTLIKLATQRDTLLQKTAKLEEELTAYRKDAQIRKIASVMKDRGSWLGTSFDERYAYVKNASANGADLQQLEQAVHMLSTDGGFGNFTEKVASRGDAKTEFISVLCGG